MQAENERDGAPEYRPPVLRRIGSIADITRAEGSGPGLTNVHNAPRGGTQIHNYSWMDGEDVGRHIGRNK
jgi:hypothetical protein